MYGRRPTGRLPTHSRKLSSVGPSSPNTRADRQLMRLLVLGTGRMATLQMQRGWTQIPDIEVVGAVDVLEANLDLFCGQFGIGRRFATVEEAIAWGGFDAVTNVTP